MDVDKKDMDKNGKKPTGTVRQFFRRISLLGILLAGGILIYSANREDIGSFLGIPEEEKEKDTLVQRPKEHSGMEATPHGMRVHRVAYGDSGESESAVENSAEMPIETSEDIAGGVVEMPEMGDSQEVGTDSENPTLPALSDSAGESDIGVMASMETETASPSAPQPMSETSPTSSYEPATGMESTSSSADNFSSSAPTETPMTPSPTTPSPTTPSPTTPSPTTPSPMTPPVSTSSESPPNLPPLVKDGSHPLKNVAGPPVQNFLEVFDFNIDPDWVTSRWSYVTSVGPLNTRGYRVPLCTGIDKSDLVGNLTYYFNHKLEVEKITFEGYTGDLERLLLTLRYFHMAKRVTSDPNVILYESPTLANNYQSYMRSYHRTTPLDGETPHHRFWITMELYPEDED